MRIGVLINARVGSRRLPGKHLKLIEGKPALSYLLERLAEFDPIIATGGKDNKDLEQLGKVEYGDPDNIPARHSQIAGRLGLDAIISVDGDDLFTSPIAVRDCIQSLQRGANLVRTEGLPYGFNVLWGYSTRMLVDSLKDLAKPNKLDTGWGWIFPKRNLYTIYYQYPDAEKISLTLDTPEDLEKFRTVIKDCPESIRKDDAKFINWLAA